MTTLLTGHAKLSSYKGYTELYSSAVIFNKVRKKKHYLDVFCLRFLKLK